MLWVMCAFVSALAVSLSTAHSKSDDALTGTALVIGQSDYAHLEKLANPRNDARKIEALLADLGFTTDVASNRNKKQLRRVFDGFLEDAEGSDVALIYYSGHGIEAGGENYLLPTDARFSSGAVPDEGLIALSDIVRRLTAVAKIAIVLVDACRTNPFPPGTLVTSDAAPDGMEVSETGLGAPKGAFAAPIEPGHASLGVVVGFAAEPGRAALDGAPETSSPYAAALLKHLSAEGVDFGDVMTMVTEEVYLRTKARQRPWTNASLRRFLYFGADPEPDTGDEAKLRGARRTLLLTIAATPNETRNFVERLAGRDDLPLDALYGMLKKFQRETTAGTAELEDLLRTVAEQLRRSLRSGDAVFPSDPEFARYTELADRAMAEGAVDLALDYRREASERAKQLSRELDATEERLKDERLRIAAAFAKHAMDAAFTFDHKTSSEMYRLAYREVRQWDEELAYLYKRSQAERLRDHGDHRGDHAALLEAIDIYQQALAHVNRADNPRDWAKIWNEVGETYSIVGERGGAMEFLEKSIVAFKLALEERTREAMPQRWAGTHDHMGTTYLIMGQRQSGKANLLRAAAAYETALDELSRGKHPMHWAGVVNNLGTARATLGRREKEIENLERAIALFKIALSERRRERVPLEWAETTDNLGATLTLLGRRLADPHILARAVAAHESSLTELERGRVPVAWAQVTGHLAAALAAQDELDGSAGTLEQAVKLYRQALEEQTTARDPLTRAATLEAYARTLLRLGVRIASRQMIMLATTALQEAWSLYRSTENTRFDDYFAWRQRTFETELARLK